MSSLFCMCKAVDLKNYGTPNHPSISHKAVNAHAILLCHVTVSMHVIGWSHKVPFVLQGLEACASGIPSERWVTQTALQEAFPSLKGDFLLLLIFLFCRSDD